MKNRFLILMMLTAIPFSVQAWENCGQINGVDSNCEYEVSSDGVLTIRPIDSNQDAIMPNYSYSYNPTSDSNYLTTAPWYDDRHNITSLQIEDGIQNISNCAFMEMRWLETVDMADSVVSIGLDAFTNDSRLTDVSLSKNLKIINKCAFQGTVNLSKLNLPEGLEATGALVNYQHKMKSLALPDSLLDSSGLSTATLRDSAIEIIYCSKEKEQACADYIKRAKKGGYALENLSYKLYEKYGNNYIYDGKFYSSLGDIGTTNHVKKRIYTIDEANAVSGKKNTFKIRYK